MVGMDTLNHEDWLDESTDVMTLIDWHSDRQDRALPSWLVNVIKEQQSLCEVPTVAAMSWVNENSNT